MFALMKISRISQLKIVKAMSESISGFYLVVVRR